MVNKLREFTDFQKQISNRGTEICHRGRAHLISCFLLIGLCWFSRGRGFLATAGAIFYVLGSTWNVRCFWSFWRLTFMRKYIQGIDKFNRISDFFDINIFPAKINQEKTRHNLRETTNMSYYRSSPIVNLLPLENDNWNVSETSRIKQWWTDIHAEYQLQIFYDLWKILILGSYDIFGLKTFVLPKLKNIQHICS